MSLRDFTLYDFLQHNARLRGDALAVVSADDRLSHQQFLARVDQLAAGLTARGITHGDRICILAQNSIDYLVLYGACAKTGAIAYPINWRLSAGEVKGVVDLAEPKMLVVGAGHVPQLEGIKLDDFQVCALMGGGEAEGFVSLSELYLEESDSSPFARAKADDPFVIISTAAVAGVPRGAVLSHQNIILNSYMLISILGLNAQDSHLAALPLFHITGLGLTLTMMMTGGSNVVLEKLDPMAAVQMMDEHNVSLIAVFPPILSMLLGAREASGARLDALKYVLGLDAPDVIRRLYTETNAKFWTGFGQSETSGFVTTVRVDQKPGATGKAIPLARVRCVNDANEDVPVGEVGEIAVQGPIVFQGYWRDPDATAHTFRNGWHHTGDLGRLDAEGYLYYAGRKPEKELIKPGGENVYPAEVEQVIQKMPQVAAVCIIGVPDPKWGEAVKAVIEPHSGASLSADEVRTFVASQIASYKKPSHVVFVEQMPRQANGAIDRMAVKGAHGK